MGLILCREKNKKSPIQKIGNSYHIEIIHGELNFSDFIFQKKTFDELLYILDHNFFFSKLNLSNSNIDGEMLIKILNHIKNIHEINCSSCSLGSISDLPTTTIKKINFSNTDILFNFKDFIKKSVFLKKLDLDGNFYTKKDLQNILFGLKMNLSIQSIPIREEYQSLFEEELYINRKYNSKKKIQEKNIKEKLRKININKIYQSLQEIHQPL